MNEHKDLKRLVRGAVQVIPLQDLQKKLDSGKKLTIKFGIDPTSSDLHLGHTVVLFKLKEFQDLGHNIVLLIGDFTARIGDPTGRSKTRPPLSKEQIADNFKTYLDQASRILDLKKITVRYNSEWLEKLGADDFITLCSRVTAARILEREDFKKRLVDQTPIALHELLYPLLQAYDSVVLKADVELGGTDQTFNLLCGRYLQEQMGQDPQVVLTMPLLEGTDGVQKMSKSYDNYIGLIEQPAEVFGKIMSISDELMAKYYLLLLGIDGVELQNKREQGIHPKELKKQLAFGVIERLWSKEDAQKAQEHFQALFEQHDYSQATPVKLPDQSPVWIVDLLKVLGAISSSSEAKRLIEAGAVHIDNVVIADFQAKIDVKAGMHIKVGKHRIYQLVD